MKETKVGRQRALYKDDVSYYADIYIAGDYDKAREICREYCQKGACVNISKVDYIYTNGEETGIKVGFVNYPRFPSSPHKIFKEAEILAKALMVGLHQGSCMIQTPDRATWIIKRLEDMKDVK